MNAAAARAEATVHRQVSKYGTTGTLTRPVVSSVSTAGAVTAGTSSTSSVICVFLPLSDYTDNREERDSLAQRGVRYLAISARGLTLEPRPHDTVTIGGTIWRIESATPINPDSASPLGHAALVVKL